MKQLLIFIIIFTSIVSGCSNNKSFERDYKYFNNKPVDRVVEMLVFSPRKPTYFPFDVNEETASMQSWNLEEGGIFQEVTFHYKNTDTNQLLNLIISYNPQIGMPEAGTRVEIRDGLLGIYKKNEGTQAFWWMDNELLYRYIYFINEGQDNIAVDEFKAITSSME